jgi:hypothetical protein
MQPVDVGKLMAAVRVLLRPDGAGADLWESETVADQITEILLHCEELGLAVSRLKARWALGLLKAHIEKRSNEQLDVAALARTVADFIELEISSRRFFTIRPENVPLMEGRPGFGDDVYARFPSAAYDIEEAGKCLALHRSTASAFHSVRCLEAGIRALARSLGISDPTKGAERSWHNALRDIGIAMEARWPKSSGRMSGDARVFDEAHAALSGMQNPWRNGTMHLDQKYTEDEARHIFDVVCGFMKKLASRMDEQGEPKA